MKVIGKMGVSKSQSDFCDGKNSEANLKLSQKNQNNEQNSPLEFKTLLNKIANDTKIAEGAPAIEDILRCIYRNQPISTKRISQYTKLPLPIISKVRTILERNRILKRDKKGAIYSKEGLQLIEKNLKFKMPYDLKCPACTGRSIILDDYFEAILKKHKIHSKNRPTVNTSIDQSYATPETATHRAAFMADRGDLEGKRILFVGDDDLTSIPTALSGLCEEVVVMDIDDRLLNLIKNISKKENLNIKTIKHDFRNSIKEEYKNSFDVVFTDPPYTIEGLKLFLARGVEALGKEGTLYLAFSHKPINEYLELQKILLNTGFVIYELLPGFNKYEGSEIIGNTTFLARLIGRNLNFNEEIDLNKLYTGEVKPVIRHYKCMNCGELHKIDGKSVRIENLVCKCGGTKFKMVKREKI